MYPRPLIGVTSYVEQARFGSWDVPVALVPHTYVRAITAAGGRAVLLPPDDVDAEVLDRLDALVLSGGADIESFRYGEPRHEETAVRPDRDASELLLLRRALLLDMPILAVCRGMQLLAVEYGGALHQHLPEVLGTNDHRPTPGVFGWPEATFDPGSRAEKILGPRLTLKCHHHQGVADAGTLRVTGRAADGIPEALEDPARRFVLGVQWHPEETHDRRLFAALVAATSDLTVGV